MVENKKIITIGRQNENEKLLKKIVKKTIDHAYEISKFDDKFISMSYSGWNLDLELNKKGISKEDFFREWEKQSGIFMGDIG